MTVLPEPPAAPTAGQIAQAARDAVDAAANTQQVATILAILQAQQITQAQQPHACQHHTPKQEFDTKKWLTIGGLACVGGCVACALALAFAVAMTAVAIGGTCATGCLLVLRSMWRQYLGEKR